MASERVTIMMNPAVAERVQQHTRNRGESLTDFYNRAIVNQLENDGDYEIRDIMEEGNHACYKIQSQPSEESGT